MKDIFVTEFYFTFSLIKQAIHLIHLSGVEGVKISVEDSARSWPCYRNGRGRHPYRYFAIDPKMNFLSFSTDSLSIFTTSTF